MPPIPPQTVQIRCPSCGNPFQTEIHTIIDVVQQPELKQQLLAGQLNVAVCSHCGAATMLGTNLAYHDPSKQLYLVYVPQESNLSAEQTEKLIGEATSILMQNQPPDAPRGHLLTPRRVMSLASLVDTILEADGIPREELEKQRRLVDLMSRLAEAMADDAQFNQLVAQHKDDITPEFLAFIEMFIQASVQQRQDMESAQVLTMLRQKLTAAMGWDEGAMLGEADTDTDVQQVVERLASVSDDELDVVVAEVRPSIDYAFFQAWTAHIESLQRAGNTEDAHRLTNRRARILEAVERMDKEAQAMFEGGVNALRDIMQAEDVEAAMRAKGEGIDDAFLLAVSANLAAAQRAGQQEMTEKLEQIGQIAFQVIQERLPPDERLINELMVAETPQERTQLLRSHAAQVTTDFVKKLNELADQQEQQGIKEQAIQLRQLAREAGAMLF